MIKGNLPPEAYTTYIYEYKLDGILEFLAGKDWIYNDVYHKEPRMKKGETFKEIRDKIFLTEKTVFELLEVLKDDGYVELEYNGSETVYACRIKFKGALFISRGGYVEQANRVQQVDRQIQENSQHTIRNAEDIRQLTAILAAAAVIASLYYIFEVVKWYYGY